MKLIAQRPFRLGGQPIKPDQPVNVEQAYAQSLIARGLAKKAPDQDGAEPASAAPAKKDK